LNLKNLPKADFHSPERGIKWLVCINYKCSVPLFEKEGLGEIFQINPSQPSLFKKARAKRGA
jgi:hypothetical protein